MNKKNLVLTARFLVAGVLIAGGVWWYIAQTPPSSISIISIANWHKPASSRQGYPILIYPDANFRYSAKLAIYSFDSKTSRSVNIAPELVGFVGPVVSPDFLYSAYVKGTNLNLVSNDTLEHTTIASPSFQSGNYISINGWSPDSEKLIFSIWWTTSEGGNGVTDAEIAQAAGISLDVGTYLFDLNAGSIEKLQFPDEYFLSFIDAHRVLFVQKDYTFVTYDINTHRIQKFTSPSPKNLLFTRFEYSGFNFSSDGTKWVFSWTTSDGTNGDHITGTSDDYITGIAYADFPKFSGTLVDSGEFGHIGWPAISPNKNLIAYAKDGGINVFNVLDGSRKYFSSLLGGAERWIDDNRLIISDMRSNMNVDPKILYIDSGQIEEMK